MIRAALRRARLEIIYWLRDAPMGEAALVAMMFGALTCAAALTGILIFGIFP